MGTISAKEKINRMRPPKPKNVEKLERYIEKLKRDGVLRENDV